MQVLRPLKMVNGHREWEMQDSESDWPSPRWDATYINQMVTLRLSIGYRQRSGPLK